MTPKSIDQQITFLYTPNLEETSRFFEDVLGLSLVLDQGKCRIHRVCKNCFLGFCQREGEADYKDGIVYTFVTEDVDSWYQHLKERDVDLHKAPEINMTHNIYHFFFSDPNGYLFEVQKFFDPHWPSKG